MRALRTMRGRVGLALALGCVGSTSAGILAACNGIVGVQDVRLRKDSSVADPGDGDPVVDDETSVPDSGPPPGPNVLEVALGSQHTCAKKPDGTVKCWGDDSKGQTGTGGTSDGGVVFSPQAVSITDAAHIASGQGHTCIVRTSGKVACWGDNQDGQLGNGSANGRSPVPLDVVGVNDATGIACGASFSCALRSGGSVMCWGNGLGGQLGNGAKQLQPSPAPVSNLTDAIAISAGESHACAVKAGGKVVCWGDGVNGQLGNGDKLERTIPTLAPSLTGMALVAAGSRSTCAAKTTGAVFCWGANEVGQLGSGLANATPNPTPAAVSGVDAIALWAGTDHACAVKRGGAVACWGAGFSGQIGDGQPRATAATPTATPSPVSGITNAIGVGTGGNHSCAPTNTAGILCWGENLHGELGDGTGTSAASPVSVLNYP